MNDTTTIGDLTVRRLGLGAMRLTGFRPALDRAYPIRVARRAVGLGVELIDTADAYGIGANEELLAEVLHPYDGCWSPPRSATPGRRRRSGSRSAGRSTSVRPRS
jgi:aryl-alcohol dehydrogenase-like predicted oxidoreductase